MFSAWDCFQSRHYFFYPEDVVCLIYSSALQTSKRYEPIYKQMREEDNKSCVKPNKKKKKRVSGNG